MVDIVANSHFRLKIQYKGHFCIITTSDLSSIAAFLQCDKMEIPNCILSDLLDVDTFLSLPEQ